MTKTKYYRLKLPKGTNDVLKRLKKEKNLKTTTLFLLAVDELVQQGPGSIYQATVERHCFNILTTTQEIDKKSIYYGNELTANELDEKLESIGSLSRKWGKQRFLGAVLYTYLKENFSEVV